MKIHRYQPMLSAMVVAAVMGFPPAIGTARDAAAPTVDAAALVDPELRPALDRIKAMGKLEFTTESLPKLRALRWSSEPLPAPAFEARSIPGPSGAPDVRVYVINAGNSGVPRPAVLHTHGGGYISGDAASSIPMLQRLAAELNCVVATVDYRLAPETRYPGSLEDNYAALKWLRDSATTLGADANRIAVMGESAGGGHAAALALAARDRGEVPLVAQILIYPMLDDRTGSSRAVPAHIGHYLWNADANRFGWGALLGRPAGSRVVPTGAVPARVVKLAGLPPTFIGVGSIDLFVDENIDYARRLVAAGVPTELLVVSGAYHGFDMIAAETSAAKSFRASWVSVLAKAFGKN